MKPFPPQQDALDHGILDLGFSAVLSLPTGSGKTMLAEWAFDRALARGERCVYLVPLKALAEERVRSWTDRWPGVPVGIYTGDYEAAATPVPYAEARIFIMTYERFDSIMRAWSRHDWVSEMGVVVVDELHMLGDPSRGPRLEGALSRCKRVNPFCRIIGLSATVSNHQEIASWLGGISYASTWRPIPLTHRVERWKKQTEKPERIASLITGSREKGGKSLVFAGSRRRAEHLARYLREQGISTAYHHAGLSLDERRRVEYEYREGDLAAIVCTPTLEMGLNLPCRQVIIADNTRWTGDRFSPISVQSYLQRAGRAGRPGQDACGEAILLQPSWGKKAPDYASLPPEPVRSHTLTGSALSEQILVEIASRCSRTRAQLVGSFAPSLLAYRQNPDFADRMDAAVDSLIAGRLLVAEDDRPILHPTRSGWVAVRHQLAPEQAIALLVISQRIEEEDLTDYDILLLLALVPGLQPVPRLSVEAAEALENLIAETPSKLLDDAPPADVAPQRLASAVLLATLFHDRMNGLLSPERQELLDVYAHDVLMAAEAVGRLAEAGADLADADLDPETLTEASLWGGLLGASASSRLRRLGRQTAMGISADAVGLTQLPGCGVAFTLMLLKHGYACLEDVALADEAELQQLSGIGPKRASEWIAAADAAMRDWEPIAVRYPARRQRSATLPADWPKHIEPGRLVRSMGLRIESCDADSYLISGGAEEHIVTSVSCDCADWQQHQGDWHCKHRLALQRHLDPDSLAQVDALVGTINRPGTIAGHLVSLALGRRFQC